MKKLLRNLCMAIAVLACADVYAQQMPPELTDPNVRVGKLENGLTYYIRHNEHPKGQADFHIAQRVGAVQEDENQNGLAHFLEHMCFNGTENFPDKAMTTWLESIGVKFGINLNAHTGTDQTVYDIMNVPVSRESVVDSCLLILHDWADGLTLADEEIDKERGVIHEEWRMGNGAVSRLLNRHAPELYPNTKYATHNVIGTMDIIDNFPPQVLRDYYEKWYRPDLQGIIVVGDINVDSVEQKIKQIFSPIKMPENPAKFDYQVVADNEQPIVISDKDKEMPANIMFVIQKFDLTPREIRNTDAGLVMNYMSSMINIMLSQRFTDIMLRPDAPFAGCYAGMGTYLYANTKGGLLAQSVVNDKGSEAALRAILTELKRVREYGFTATEYDRARTEYLSSLEAKYNDRENAENNVYTQRYISNFLDNAPIADIDYVYEKMKALVPMIPVQALNQYIQQHVLTGNKNLVVFSLCPEKPEVTVPTKDALMAVINEVEQAKVEPYVDNTINEPLISTLPTPGKIVKTTENKEIGYTELELSNGVRVLLRPNDFKEEVRMVAESKGGASLYGFEDYANARLAADMICTTGLGKFSLTDLQKLMSGKQANVNLSIADYSESVDGWAVPKDLETMMQLLYLYFTQPREDKASFENVRSMMISQLENYSHDPQYVFQDSVTHILYAHHPTAMIQSKEMVEQVDYDRMLAIYKERFSNAADFTFVFSGKFDMDTMKTYVEQYIGSLPASGQKEKAVDDGKQFAKGIVEREFVMKNETKLAMLAMIWSGNLPYTPENKLKVNVAGQLMATELLNSVREDEGAAYSPYSFGSMIRTYKDWFLIQTAFGLNPDKCEKSSQMVIHCLEKLATNVEESELAKVKEYMLKHADEVVRENDYWNGVMVDYAVEGIDTYTGYKNLIESLTTADMQQFIGSLIGQGNRCEVIMIPE